MSAWFDAAARITRRWTSLYTTALPEELKSHRRSEIEGDLWEHWQAGQLEGDSDLHTAFNILSRMVRGLPADVSWRWEAGFMRENEANLAVTETPGERLALLIGLALGAVPVFLGLAVVAGNGEWDSATERILFGLLWAVLGGIIVAGLMLSRRAPRIGLALVFVGAMAICVAWYWAAIIMIPGALVLLAISYKRGKHSGWPSGSGAA